MAQVKLRNNTKKIKKLLLFLPLISSRAIENKYSFFKKTPPPQNIEAFMLFLIILLIAYNCISIFLQ
jgi:hypothetical protein